MLFIALLITFGLVVSGVLPLQQYFERENQVIDAREQLDELTTANAVLADQAEALLSEQEIERIAREQYGFVREGEIGYVVETPEAIVGATAEEAPVVVEVADESGFLDKIWNFISGRDASSDG